MEFLTTLFALYFFISLRIPLHSLKRASLARLRPVDYLSSAFYTEQTKACLFSESYIYSSLPLSYLKPKSCGFLTIPRSLVCFGPDL